MDCEALSVTATSSHGAVLEWASTEAGTSRLRYTVSGVETERTASADPAASHTARLHGLPPLTEVSYRALTTIDGEEQACEGSFTTGGLPSGLPGITVTAYEPEQTSAARYFVGTAMQNDASYPFIIDREGRWIWHTEVELGLSPQMELADDGDGLLLADFSVDRAVDEGVLLRLDLDGAVQGETRLVDGHHLFEQLPGQQTVAHFSIDVRDWYNAEQDNTVSVVGDALMELSLEDGASAEVFNAWDWREPEPHGYWASEFYPQGRDWTHANSVIYDPQRDSYLISFAHVRAILEVGRDGTLIQEFSPETCRHADPALRFSLPHDVRWSEDGELMMINHYEGGVTTAVTYAVTEEEDGCLLTPSWSYEAGVSAPLLGQVLELENGNRLINFGGSGLIQEITAAGTVVWEVQSELGTWFGNGELVDDIYAAAGE